MHRNPPDPSGENILAADAAVATWKEPPHWLPAVFHSLAYRNYSLLVIGQVSNSLAQWVDMVARPIMMIALTGSAVQVGLVAMARGVPMLFLGPISGILADRMDRRFLMLIAKVLSQVVNIAFTALILTGRLEIWHIYATAILRSVLMAFDQPARQALLPSLVPPRLLVNAIALNSGSMQVVRIVSASLTGVMIAVWAKAFGFAEDDVRVFGGAYVLTVVAYAVAIIATYMLRVPAGGNAKHTNDSWGGSFLEGLRYVLHNPVILGILILLAVQTTFGMPYQSVFVPWLAIKVMDIGPEGAGMLIAVSGFGSLLGAMAVAARGHLLRRRGLIILIALALYGGSLAALGLTSALPLVGVIGLTLPLLPIITLFLVGLAQTSLMSMKNMVLLEDTPNDLRGRVMSFQSWDRGFQTLGGGLGGFAIAAMGGPFALAAFGATCILGALVVGILMPRLRNHN
ncbi:MAG: MFS transporter [Chloroflexi bacterium]|nr:MFS transporter [Chloroflexota bacterium]